MKRAGFTMIELIFVIVILGILAAVAVPKLAATRDDAKIAKGATELATAIGDMGSYYTSKGSLGVANLMTNVFSDNSITDMNTSGATLTYEGCISIIAEEGVTGTGSDRVRVAYTQSGASNVCKGIAKAAYKITGADRTLTDPTDSNMTHVFGGSGVIW